MSWIYQRPTSSSIYNLHYVYNNIIVKTALAFLMIPAHVCSLIHDNNQIKTGVLKNTFTENFYVESCETYSTILYIFT